MSMPPQKKLKVSEPSVGESGNGKRSSSRNVNSKKSNSIRDWDWRSTNWSSRNHLALKNNFLCDVTFEVGIDAKNRMSFQAHRLILALASPVFEAMFFGQLSEKGESVIITDLLPDGFELMLRYIYSDEFVFDGCVDNLIHLWIAADKYCIPRIKADCESQFNFIVLSPVNVWSTLQIGLFLGIKGMVEKCHTYLAAHTDSALVQFHVLEELPFINPETMTDFLSMNLLRTKELSLLSALIKWGETQKSLRDLTLKEAVKPFLGLIRFGALTTVEFCQFLDQAKGVMSDANALAILKHLTKPKSYPLPDWCTSKSWSRNPTTQDAGSGDSDDSSSSDSSSSSSDSTVTSGSDYRRRRRHPAGDNQRPPRSPIDEDSSLASD